MIEKFQKAPFEEIAAQCESKVSEQMVKGVDVECDFVETFLVIGWLVGSELQTSQQNTTPVSDRDRKLGSYSYEASAVSLCNISC